MTLCCWGVSAPGPRPGRSSGQWAQDLSHDPAGVRGRVAEGGQREADPNRGAGVERCRTAAVKGQILLSNIQ